MLLGFGKHLFAQVTLAFDDVKGYKKVEHILSYQVQLYKENF